MPRMDGAALTRYVLSNLSGTPIMLMTAYDFDDRKLIRDAGVAYLTKPLSLVELLSTIEKVLTNNAAG